ncbi:MAG: ParB/RepB/Spo0J family partition protein [Candidatus Omnitrophica bacterium]|nr:ParB/RepB/Spo0J family partition protein [Candidatus Omnitrophota bacterium]
MTGGSMENRALGKGLSALIPDKVSKAEGEVTFLKTELIQDNPFQPRTHYDESKLAELKASIKEKGILVPILVRLKDGRHEVVAGERRLKAARSLNVPEVPAIIREVSDQEALVLALVENIQREELNPIEEAAAYKKLIEEFRYTQDMVAGSVGKDRSTITNLLRLLKLPAEIQQSVYDNGLSVGHARALLSVESPGEQKRLFDLAIKKGLSVRELEELVRTGGKDNARRAKTQKTRDHEVAALEEQLQNTLGTKVSIQARKKKGKIVIEYYSLDDLDRIIAKIKS